jgi:hypothetical protein
MIPVYGNRSLQKIACAPCGKPSSHWLLGSDELEAKRGKPFSLFAMMLATNAYPIIMPKSVLIYPTINDVANTK